MRPPLHIPFVLAFLSTLPAFGKVSLPKFFSDNMVLQRGTEVSIWGWAKPQEAVAVTFGGQTKRTRADGQGNWTLRLDPMVASHEGRTLAVNDSVRFENVLVGDVWLCSGQSNMDWPVRNCLDAKQEIAAANHPSIRHIKIKQQAGAVPQRDVRQVAGWDVCTPEKVGEFTAAGYFFARELARELNVPIGLLNSSWPGTRIEPWTAPEGFHMVPELADISARIKAVDPADPAGKAAYLKTIEQIGQWVTAAKATVEAGKRPGPLPQFPALGTDQGAPTHIYNEMIHPLTPFAVKGVIWYQGESNSKDAMGYVPKQKALIDGWRKVWNQGDFPFYFVQLASFRSSPDTPEGGEDWTVLREAQRKALEVKNTGMAVTIDIGNSADPHPRNKQDVGKRLARWALAGTYGREIVPSGPLFEAITVHGDRIHVRFNHVGSGLMVGQKKGLEPTREVPGGQLKHFAIAGADKVWHWAEAVIDGDAVVVSSSEVARPVAVRYAYRMNPEGANLYNKEGLPASPFRTDDW